ncbi:hypothetical protein CsSME_00006528 [Camellia sinensis var. sinensis]
MNIGPSWTMDRYGPQYEGLSKKASNPVRSKQDLKLRPVPEVHCYLGPGERGSSVAGSPPTELVRSQHITVSLAVSSKPKYDKPSLRYFCVSSVRHFYG